MADVVLRALRGGRDKVPENIQLFLPWNLSEEKKETVASLLGSLIPRPVIGPGE